MNNNTKNASTNYSFFELNYSYYPCILYKENINLCFLSKIVNKLVAKLQKLMIIYCNQFYNTQKF